MKLKFQLIVADASAITATCAASAWGASRYGWEISIPFLGLGAEVITPTAGVLWLIALAVNSSWDTRLLLSGTEYYVRVLRATFLAFVGAGLVGFVGNVDAARPFVLFALPLGTLVIIGDRWLLRSRARKHAPLRRAVIIGLNHRDSQSALLADSALRIQVVDAREIVHSNELPEWRRSTEADVVVIGANHGLGQQELRELMWALNEEGVEVWFDTASQFMRSGRSVMIPSKQTTLMLIEPIHLSVGQQLVKRSFDIIFSLLAILLLLPVLAMAMLTILLTMGRPIFFQQQRIGQDGKEFTLLKLRTMANSRAAGYSADLAKNPNDPRITAMGRILRRWSIDEIPQFLNVLVGTMSVVGPRPRLPEEVISSSVTSRRLRARPGITGPWQTSGRSLMSLNEADALDVDYVDSWTLLGDVVLVIRTIREVISGRGAY